MRLPGHWLVEWVALAVTVVLAAQLVLFGLSELFAGRLRGLVFLGLAALLVAAERYLGVERFL